MSIVRAGANLLAGTCCSALLAFNGRSSLFLWPFNPFGRISFETTNQNLLAVSFFQFHHRRNNDDIDVFLFFFLLTRGNNLPNSSFVCPESVETMEPIDGSVESWKRY